MPQFNPLSFSSQLFWLIICFGVFYICMSKIFLPRIRKILHERNHDIDHNTSLAEEINEQVEEIKITSTSLRDAANSQYKLAIENAVKQASLQREQDLQNLRNEIAKMIEKSNNEISEFKNKSKAEFQKTIDFLVSEIGNKFFNKTN